MKSKHHSIEILLSSDEIIVADDFCSIKDVYIGVMGVTGAGKSTFIATCTDKFVQVGHKLESCEYVSSMLGCKDTNLLHRYDRC